MPEGCTRKFRFKHDISWSWHIGLFFCIEPKNVTGKRDYYLFFCFGRHDFSLGMITESEDEC